MVQTLTSFCNRIIEYSFYAIFLLVPLTFTSTTSELFELNKIWLTFGITLIIAASWFSKMILQRKFFIQKTPLDIPIVLFLLAHIISTIFSIDPHISWWGYYSRFNGGLYSMLSYIFLYYAFVSNFLTKAAKVPQVSQVSKAFGTFGTSDTFDTSVVKKSLIISLISGTIVALWGFPSHFGYDPTCLVFRGTLDVSCWTEAFQPKVRIFSTLGQPNWLATYLSILLPLALAFGIKNYELRITNYGKNKKIILTSLFLILASLFYVDIIYTGSQSGFLGTCIGIGIFLTGLGYLFSRTTSQKTIYKWTVGIGFSSLLIAFLLGQPISQLNRFTLPELQKNFASVVTTKSQPTKPIAQSGTALEGGGTNSGIIRKNVWQGAIDAWRDNPLFGTGVETFAFAYYRYRPASHNMTSEWDYLYNKAHNEYLNYLTTTGILGLGSYLLMIGVFVFLTVKYLFFHRSSEILNPKSLIILALLAGYCSMLVINFFGFSVVVGNIYLFMIPAFVLILAGKLTPDIPIIPSFAKSNSMPETKKSAEVSSLQWVGIIMVWIYVFVQIYSLIAFWYADQAFALAQNLNRIGQYNEGYKKIREAIALRSDEPVFREELETNDAVIAVALSGQKQNTQASQLANEAIQITNQLTSDYPNNINFLKSEVRVYYTLSQLNPAYLRNALETMKKIVFLAPTDAKISYNLGVLYGQNGQTQKGIDVLEKTVKLKPDYRDAYFALGLFYHDLGVAPANGASKSDRITNPQMQQKAVKQMHYILSHFGQNDKAVTDTLKTWGK